jgi:hypothetical protein
LPFFEETVFFELLVFEVAVFFVDEAVLGAAFAAGVFGAVLLGTVWVFFVGVVCVDCGSASDPANADKMNSVKPYFMCKRKGRYYRSKPPLYILRD